MLKLLAHYLALCVQDITSICKALPALEVINLTRNFLEDEIGVAELSLLDRIRVLVLNNCDVTWEQVTL